MSNDPASWFASTRFLPPEPSVLGSPGLLWTSVVADLLIAAACFTIPLVLLYATRRRKELRFDALVMCFGVFMIAAGLLHVVSAWSVWHPDDWLSGSVKLIAAAASVPTAILLWRALPDIRALPTPRQFREVNESLARAQRELEAFTASVSHDLRSPLTTIAGQAGLLELSMPSANEEQKRRLQRIQGSVRQMSGLIDALLVLSRISRHTLHRETIDVTLVLENLIQDLRQREPARRVEVLLQPGMSVHGDPRLIRDLFQNLLSNAWKFTSKTPQPRIEIGQSKQGSMSTLHVRDNGAGFDMTYAHKLFKPFQRLHGPTEFAGSGLGLATVARIVDRHGGRVWAEGRQNAGAVFYCTLPLEPITQECLVERRALA